MCPWLGSVFSIDLFLNLASEIQVLQSYVANIAADYMHPGTALWRPAVTTLHAVSIKKYLRNIT